jgi:transposase
MGKRKRHRQQPLWIAAERLAKGPGHPFYSRLNEILAKKGFDDFAEAACKGFYAERMGRPSLAPGVYFRLLLIGYFEGIDSERGIAWRVADSIGLREFLGLGRFLNALRPQSVFRSLAAPTNLAYPVAP